MQRRFLIPTIMNRRKELERAISGGLNVARRARTAAKLATDPIEKEGDWHLAFSELENAKRCKKRLKELEQKQNK